MSEPESLGEIIGGGGFQALKGKRQKLELLKIHWTGIAGEREARHSSPTKLSRRVLVVAAEGPSWAAELSMKTEDLLKGIQRVTGNTDVQKIKIQARSSSTSAGKAADGPAARGEDPGRISSVQLGVQVEAELDSIPQEETKNALARMLKASVSSKQYKPD